MPTSHKIQIFDIKPDQSFKKKAVRSGGITMMTHVLDYVIQIASTAVIARILEPSDYGLVAIALAATGFFFIFKTLGLSDATVQRQQITHEQVSNLFWINVAAGFLFTILLLLTAPVISHIFNDKRLTNIISVSSVSFVITGFYTQHQALLKRSMRFTALAVNEIVAISLSVIVAVIMALSGFGYWVLVFRPLVLTTCIAIGCWILCKWRPGIPTRRSGIRPMLKFGVNTIAYYIVDYIARNTDKAFIGWKEGPSPLGFYSKAFQLFLAPVSQLTIPLTGVAVSTLSKLVSEPAKYHSYFLNAVQAVAFIGFPLSMFLVANSELLIVLLLGKKWIPAAELFSILGLAGGIQLITSTRAWLFVSLGRTDRWFYTGVAASIIMTVFIFVGIQFGTKGVAIAYSSFVYLSIVPSLWYAGLPIGLRFRSVLAVLWRSFLAALAAAGINLYAHDYILIFSNIVNLIISFILFSGIYSILLLLLNGNAKPFISFYNLLKFLLPERITAQKKSQTIIKDDR